MSEKASAGKSANQTTAVASRPGHVAAAVRQPVSNVSPFGQFQRTLGNQAMLQLLASGVIQAKLRVSQPGDADEQEADRAADFVTKRTRAPQVQRKCAGGDSCHCSKCSEEDHLHLSPSSGLIHRQQKENSPNPINNSRETSPAGPSAGFLVDDAATSLRQGQMKKSVFLAQVDALVCATANAELKAAGRSADQCPYISKWISFYGGESASHIERALWKYAPETATASSATDYFSAIQRRVRQAAATWAKTGKITGLPAGVSMMPSGAGPSSSSPAGNKSVQFKEEPGSSPSYADPETIRSQLGSGQSLDSRVQSRMSSVFGHNFSGVRIHTDSRATSLSSDLNARAFTIGSDVAFAAGEYRPGSLIGDALIAHELAHVVQQSGAHTHSSFNSAESTALEHDADTSAVRAVSSAWSNSKTGLAKLGGNAIPALKSGLKLQRCSQKVKICPKGYSWRVQSTTGMGSFGSLCHWKCMPGEPASAPSYDGPSVSCPPEMNCDTGVRYEELDSSYTKTGYGASFTPLGEQAYTGCFPLDMDGKKVSDVPLRPTDFEMTDVVAPLADMAAAAKNRNAKPRVDPTTGKVLPDREPHSTESNARPGGSVVVGNRGVDVEVGSMRVNEYRNEFNAGKNRNVAFADFEVNGNKGTLVGISGKAEREGTVSPPESAQLPTLVIGHDRSLDSEKKILEHLTSVIGDNPNATGTIRMFSERTVCASCDLAASQFRAKYPKITLDIISGGK
jgi:Domain of unknown function (DUF4157)/The  BURPS668_1122 family of deaminases